MELRQRGVLVDAGDAFAELAQGAVVGGGVGDLAGARRGEQVENRIGAGDQSVPPAWFAGLEARGLGAQHQVREIHRPLMRRQVGTLGLRAQVAQEALIHHFAVVGLVDAVDLEGVGSVDEVEQGGERRTEIDAAPAPVADVENAL